MGSIKSCTQQNLDRSLEDTYKELLPLTPPGFESMYDAQGMNPETLPYGKTLHNMMIS
jgi:hypothetical protein